MTLVLIKVIHTCHCHCDLHRACDACEEWYHGDCVSITQSEANNIHHYYCQWCIEKDPSLEIEYKKKSGSSGQSKDKSQKAERKAGRPKKTTTEKLCK